MNIFKKVKKLNLPKGKYVVIGGASLAARGIRSANDIDLLVLPDIFEELIKSRGFQKKTFPDGNITLMKDVFEIGKRFMTIGYNPPALGVIKNAEIIGGVPFTSLEEEIKFKKAMNRPKDLEDIKLIENYLKNHEN